MNYNQFTVDMSPRSCNPHQIQFQTTGKTMPTLWLGEATEWQAINNSQVIFQGYINQGYTLAMFQAEAQRRWKYNQEFTPFEPLLEIEEAETYVIDSFTGKVVPHSEYDINYQDRKRQEARSRSNSNFDAYNEQRKIAAQQKQI
jgi:hypothetical protein